MIPSWASQTITRIRAGIKVERGSEVPDWLNSQSVTISPCSVQPASSSVSLDGRVLGLNDSYNVYCNPDADVLAGDHIVYGGQTYTVMEEPRIWTSPTGRVSNLQFTMTRWAG